VLAGGGLVGLAIVAAAASGLRTCLVIGVARHGAPALSPSLNGLLRDDLRRVADYGLKVQVTSATGAVNLEVDRFVLSGFFGPSVVAGFELGARWANLFRLVPAFALVAMFPMAVAQTVIHGSAWLDQFQLTATKYLTALAATGAAALVVSADPLIRAWLGRPTAWAAASIAILVPAYAITLAAGATGILTRVEGHPGRETGYALLSAGLNLALTWPLLSLLGPIGVPLATAIGITVGTGYFLFSYQQATHRPLTPLLRVVVRPVLAALIAGGAVALLAGFLPDGAGRAMAGLAVVCRCLLVLVLTATLLAAAGFFSGGDLARLRRLLGHRIPRLLPLAGGDG
jgi:O-antigen/teichoic acid export membrane protein